MNWLSIARTANVLTLAALIGAPHARAQEPDKSGTPPRPTPVQIQPPQDDAQREMVQLFGQVERQLRAIDRLLQEASRAPTAGSDGSLAEQLRNAQTSGEEVQRNIDRILELAASQQPSSSSPSSGEPKPGDGSSPIDGQGEQSTGREATPSAPKPGGDKPESGEQPGDSGPKKPGEEKPGDQQSGPKPEPGEDGREKSDGPQRSQSDPQQKPGSDPAAGAQGSGTPPVDARDRWGDLPFHAREVFRNEGGRDMPPLYRDWIDAYYRRLNKQP